MKRTITSNSFTRKQVQMMFRMLNALLQGRDVTAYFRSEEFREVYLKFKAMYKKWEASERKD